MVIGWRLQFLLVYYSPLLTFLVKENREKGNTSMGLVKSVLQTCILWLPSIILCVFLESNVILRCCFVASLE